MIFLNTAELNNVSSDSTPEQLLFTARTGTYCDVLVSKLEQAGRICNRRTNLTLFEQGIRFETGLAINPFNPLDVLCFDPAERIEIKPVETLVREISVPSVMLQLIGVLFRQEQEGDLPKIEQLKPIMVELMIERIATATAPQLPGVPAELYDEEPLDVDFADAFDAELADAA